MKCNRMGIVGIGGISEVHIEGIKKSSNLILAAICDINEGLLHKKGQIYEIPEKFRFIDYTDMLKSSEIDAVSICTPNDSHFRIAKDAVIYNKHFALEKPTCMNSSESSELCSMIFPMKVKNMVCFSYRFKSAARYARYLIENGHLGNINHIYVRYFQSWGQDHEIPLVWRFEKERSGSGVLGDLGSHMIDMVRFLVGDMEKVCGHAGTIIQNRKKENSDSSETVDVDDFCNFMAVLKGGIPVTVELTRFAFGRENYQVIEIYGDKGGLVYKLDREDELQVCMGNIYGNLYDYHSIRVPDIFKGDQMQSFSDILNNCADGLAADIFDGHYTQKVLDAVIESFDNEKWVEVKEDEWK